MALWKKIVLICVTMLVVGYLVGSAVWVHLRSNSVVCNTLSIEIQDESKRQYLNRSELAALLKQKHIYPIGQLMDSVKVREIEAVVESHPMVRHAECFARTGGEVVVRLSQRIPLLRVVTGAETYFVDTDHTRMPIRESVKDKVMLVEGEVGQRMACEEIADLVLLIRTDKYWRGRISKVRVRNPRYVELIEQPRGNIIILGECRDVKEKLSRLKTYYENGAAELDLPEYREYDLRYADQVIGRK